MKLRTLGFLFLTVLLVLMLFSNTIYTYNQPTVEAAIPKYGTLKKAMSASAAVQWADIRELYAKVSGTVSQVGIKPGDEVLGGQSLVTLDCEAGGLELELTQLQITEDLLNVDIECIDMRLRVKNEDLETLQKKPQTSQRRIQVRDLQLDISLMEQDKKGKNLSIQENQAQQADVQRQLQALVDGKVTKAPADGRLVSVLIHDGQSLNQGQLIAAMGIGNRFKLECDIGVDNNYISIGDECGLGKANQPLSSVGVVTNIVPFDGEKIATIEFTSNEVSPGETLEVRFQKELEGSAILLSSAAVGHDLDGYFVYVIRRRKAILGDEYYTHRLNVSIGDSDNENTVITRGIDIFEPMAVYSTGTYGEGTAVKIGNEGDLLNE